MDVAATREIIIALSRTDIILINEMITKTQYSMVA